MGTAGMPSHATPWMSGETGRPFQLMRKAVLYRWRWSKQTRHNRLCPTIVPTKMTIKTGRWLSSARLLVWGPSQTPLLHRHCFPTHQCHAEKPTRPCLSIPGFTGAHHHHYDHPLTSSGMLKTLPMISRFRGSPMHFFHFHCPHLTNVLTLHINLVIGHPLIAPLGICAFTAVDSHQFSLLHIMPYVQLHCSLLIPTGLS